MKLVSIAEMKEIEAEANSRGITYEMMMETAGKGVASIIQFSYSQTDGHNSAVGLVGSGNNGGDTLIALTELAGHGWEAKAYLVRPRPTDDPLFQRLLAAGGAIFSITQDKKFQTLDDWLASSHVLLDGVLGTGFQLPLKPELATVLGHVATLSRLPFTTAVDCPSGVDCDSGDAAAEVIRADTTICMQAIKTGLLRFPAFTKVGQLALVDLGLPDNLNTWTRINQELLDEKWIQTALPDRPLDGHKGTFGTVMVAAGSINYTGAAILAAKGAYRIGAGLVQVAIPGSIHSAIAGYLPEATWVLLPHEMGVISKDAYEIVVKNLDRVTVLLLGPGWGLEDTTAEFLTRLLGGNASHARGGIGFMGSHKDGESSSSVATKLPPLVIDADGLKLLARIPGWWKLLANTAILTPHPGEMSVLTGLPVSEIQGNRLDIARRFAQEWGQVVVLKGANTVVAGPDGRIAVTGIATTALAHAGTGDVLAGMIAGLRSQGLSAFNSAAVGTWIHARAGVAAAEWIGHPAAVLASDVLDSVADVLQQVDPQ
jgi:ADP-dependent NAD(P)H-hydrate dehydratase / NAD(P)H-hydrate epimerase